ncbi:MAG: TaqI-like C-terminal specificity domain-containing protein [Paludibacter sp.]|nr:TaqI-like C-terminal specificity domain-containing protein [Paludibacter sp.]
MSLFQATVINKYLKMQDKQVIHDAYILFKAHFHNVSIQENIRNSKEEQYQEGFLTDLFVNTLGYVKNPTPNYNLTTEYKNVKDSKKADGAIIIGNKVKAVIELKGTNTTDLGNVEIQAFGYKNNQPECDYIITSNFEKLRFYIDNAIEHIEFNLFTLSEKEFELLYLCLSFQSIEKNIPKKIKEESISHEDKITKQLYNDYSLFKRELYQNLIALNPEYDALVLFKKSQKLLDRYLFLFFAEDRQLLPPNSVRMILSQWHELREMDKYSPLYSRFKKFFGYLNTGYKGKYDVFAYNGGLFKPDDVLDNVTIDDELLYKHTLKLSEYDFESEVDVNILGHIFENSLNELDEVKAQLTGSEVDKTKSKRKKDGVFYTPKYITKYIVDNTVGKLCAQRRPLTPEGELSKKAKVKYFNELKEYREWLLQITICDPACGSGAFLNQALNFLIEEHRTIDEMQAKLFGDSLVLSDIENTILENNLFGVDLNEESVEIAKLSLWLRTAQPNRKLNDLSNNIKCGNSLIDDPAVAGDKAFNWEQEFPQVFTPGKELSPKVKVEKAETPDYLKLIKEKSLEAQAKAEQAIALSKEAAEISKKVYEYAKKLENVSEADSAYGIFKGGFDVVIGNPPYLNMTKNNTDYKQLEFYNQKYESIKNANSKNLYTLFNEKSIQLVKTNGIVSFIIPEGFLKTRSYDDCVNKMNKYGKITKAVYFEDWVFEDATTGSVIFEFVNHKTNHEFKEYIMNRNHDVFKLEKDRNSVIERYNELKCPILSDICDMFKGMAVKDRSNFIYNEKNNLPNTFLLGNCIDRYSFKNSFYCDYEKLTIVGGTKNKAKHDISPRILIRRTGNYLCCVMLNEPALTESTLYSCSAKTDNIDLNYLLSILNSKLLTYVVRQNMITNEQAFPQIMMTDIQLLKIIIASKDTQLNLSEKTKILFSLNKELQEVSGKFQRTIQRKFSLDDLPGKLQNWYLLTYAEFIAELGKKKVKLSLTDEAEWESYFVQEKESALAIKNQLETTDRKINQMVYALYGLTDEEISIVETK